MVDWDACLALVRLPNRLRCLAADGSALGLLAAGDRPRCFYGYPPALLPLWEMSRFTYHGLWCHPLTQRRVSWVAFSAEDDRYVTERSRMFDQQ